MTSSSVSQKPKQVHYLLSDHDAGFFQHSQVLHTTLQEVSLSFGADNYQLLGTFKQESILGSHAVLSLDTTSKPDCNELYKANLGATRMASAGKGGERERDELQFKEFSRSESLSCCPWKDWLPTPRRFLFSWLHAPRANSTFSWLSSPIEKVAKLLKTKTTGCNPTHA